MLGTGTGMHTPEARLKDLLETQNMVKTLIRQYTYTLNNYDKIIAGFDAEIAVITDQRSTAIQDFKNAPAKLPALAVQLKELQSRYTDIKDTSSGKADRIKRYKALRDRLARLEDELKAEGINVDIDGEPADPTENL